MSQMFNNDPYYTLSEMVEQTGYNRSTLDNKVRQLVKELEFQKPNEERPVPIWVYIDGEVRNEQGSTKQKLYHYDLSWIIQQRSEKSNDTRVLKATIEAYKQKLDEAEGRNDAAQDEINRLHEEITQLQNFDPYDRDIDLQTTMSREVYEAARNLNNIVAKLKKREADIEERLNF